MNHRQLRDEDLIPWWRHRKFCDIMRYYEKHTRLWHFAMRLTQVGNKLLSRINIFQDLLQKFIGKPLFHGGGIQLHVLHTSRLETGKPGKQQRRLCDFGASTVLPTLTSFSTYESLFWLSDPAYLSDFPLHMEPSLSVHLYYNHFWKDFSKRFSLCNQQIRSWG